MGWKKVGRENKEYGGVEWRVGGKRRSRTVNVVSDVWTALKQGWLRSQAARLSENNLAEKQGACEGENEAHD